MRKINNTTNRNISNSLKVDTNKSYENNKMQNTVTNTTISSKANDNKNLTTVAVNKITIDKQWVDTYVKSERENRVIKFIEILTKFNNKIEKIANKKFVKISNKDIYFFNGMKAVVPNLKNFAIGHCHTYFSFEVSSFNSKFCGYVGEIPTLIQMREIVNAGKDFFDFNTDVDKNRNKIWLVTVSKDGSIYGAYIDNVNSIISFHGDDGGYSYHIPIFEFKNQKSFLQIIIEEDFIPDDFDSETVKLFNLLKEYYKNGYLIIQDNKFKNSSKFTTDMIDQSLLSLCNISFKKEDIIKDMSVAVVDENDVFYKVFVDSLLACDDKRAKIEPYKVKRLDDPNLGHWDLWENVCSSTVNSNNSNNSNENSTVSVKLKKSLEARNPIKDIKNDGIVGIDFGTKSTIVVYQDGNDITHPMRVGMAQYSKKLEKSHYENPTVMEFINLNAFLAKYGAMQGRPHTDWEDLTISHTANNSLLSANTKSNEFYSFFNDLKQWAGDKRRQIKIRDKNGFETLLPSYLDIKDGNFDPVEIYAYYLGLYINNMHNGIYLNYLLSFPVTYEVEIRNKIINSFEKGLKKSLPLTVLRDVDSMKKFKVVQGASEPAAYAICALEQYGFDPDEDSGEKIFYGIFDFGGGTTDFDFGIWRSATEAEDRFDYVINHFGAGGDQYLGGENLLELLSFEVFKQNQDKLRKEDISFTKPPECQAFAGSEILISESQEARLNIKQLMEKLRPLWEENNGYEKTYENGVLKVNLFDNKGNPKINFELSINLKFLKKILSDRIEKGVRNFFEALKLTFDNKNTDNIDKIVIFLAGNSSKSGLVWELFNKYIQSNKADIVQKLGEQSEGKEFYVLYPPLGTEEAFAIQKGKNIIIDKNDLTTPTGKTGVAFGLIEGRDGGVVKVISEINATDEIKFNFYIGRKKKNKFKPVIDRNVKYNEWIKFITADATEFEMYYTNLPEAASKQLSTKELSKKICQINSVSEDAYVYVRAIKPSTVEYVVANEGKLAKNEYLSNIETLDLSL